MVGKPQHNIKDVSDNNNEQLKNELEKTRKLLIAYRMLHHEETIKDVRLNIINREAELTKPLIRLFQDSPGVLKELLPALSKCLDAKRKVKSNSLEAILYTAILNLISNHGLIIDNASIIEEVKRITEGEDIQGQQAFYCQDLDRITHRKIIGTLRDKFKASRTSKGRDKDKKRALRFTDEDLDRKGIEYDVPDKIEILPTNEEIASGPDSFDSILLQDKMGTQGTLGTVLEGMDEGTKGKDDGQIVNEMQDAKDVITLENSPDGQIVKETQDTEDVTKPENSPTHTLEASPPSPPSPRFECYFEGCGQRFSSQSELIAHMDKESAEKALTLCDKNDSNPINISEQNLNNDVDNTIEKQVGIPVKSSDPSNPSATSGVDPDIPTGKEQDR